MKTLEKTQFEEYPETIIVDRFQLAAIFDRLFPDRLTVSVSGKIVQFKNHAEKWYRYDAIGGLFYVLPPGKYNTSGLCCVGFRYGTKPEEYVSFENIPGSEISALTDKPLH